MAEVETTRRGHRQHGSGSTSGATVLPGKSSRPAQGLGEDPWLKEQGILPPGDKNAPFNTGTVLWRLLDTNFQRVRQTNLSRLLFHLTGRRL